MRTNSEKQAANLDQLRIATPCPIGWEQMTGDNRVRFCGHCQLNVYNIAELSRTEAEALISSSEGRICGRLYRRVDGTILTKDCPVGLRALRMRVSKRVAAVFAAIVSISSMAFGQQSAKGGKTGCTPQSRISRTSAASDSAGRVLSGMVVDANGAVIPGAKVTVINTDAKRVATTSTNDEGGFEFNSLAAGTYSIKTELTGYKTHLLKRVVVTKDELVNLQLILDPATTLVTVGILELPPSLFDSKSGTTIIRGDIIQRLPLK